jgi:L-lactate dehydrogenase complex protein LldE
MPDKKKPARVYFFGTCVIDLLYPEAGMAAIRLLEREGLEVIFPSGQSCCGQPAFNSGFPAEAREVARRQIRLFQQDYPIVVPSGSCAGMMKHHYPELFAGERDEPWPGKPGPWSIPIRSCSGSMPERLPVSGGCCRSSGR